MSRLRDIAGNNMMLFCVNLIAWQFQFILGFEYKNLTKTQKTAIVLCM